MILLQINIWGFEGDLRITTSPRSYFENFVVMCSEIMMSSEYMVGSIEGPEHYGNHNENNKNISIKKSWKKKTYNDQFGDVFYEAMCYAPIL